MKRLFKSRLVAALTLVAVALVSVQCGFILYPERRNQTEGRIDPVVLIMDCLWFFAGVIPGVVALAVDFLTGSIYEPGRKVSVKPGDRVAFRLNAPAPYDADLQVSITDPAGIAVCPDLLSRHVALGERVGQVTLTIPENLPTGEYLLAIQVNGVTSSSWNLNL